MKIILRILVIYAIAICLMAGCVSKPAGGPNYYLLSSEQLTSQALDLKAFTLALGPVDVPAHLDREGIATHDGQNQINYSDIHRWAESLRKNLIKILNANLTQLLPNQQLIEFPYRQSNRPDYQLSISIEKFGYINDGSVVLQARNVLLDARGRQIDSNFIDLRQVQPEKDHAEIVRHMSILLGEMAVELVNRFSDKF